MTPKLERIRRRLERLYGAAADNCLERLKMLMGRYGVGSSPPSAVEERDQREIVLITYGDSIKSETEYPLQTLRRLLDQYLRGAVSTVHILPFFPYSSDDGFSVVDYREVNPALGTWQDIRAIGQDFDLMVDLVLNHVSRSSSWFKDYMSGISPARHYFLEVDPSTDVSAVVRPRNLPLLTPAMTRDGRRFVWTTFSSDQIDLNFANPDVLFEFLDIVLLYIANDARIVRIDAIAYLWKDVGTSCIHLPETHEVVKLFRDVIDLVAPGVLVLTETNVPHEENVSYFGDGDEAHAVYQFSLPPLLLHALHTGSVRYLKSWASSLPDPPPGCTFLNFTASHDGIGVRPLEGIIPDAEFRFLLGRIRERGGKVSTKRNADGTESPYELNITYFDALSDTDHWGSPMHIRRFLCAQTVALELKGIPAVYIHSLTATPNYHEGVARTGRVRTINRKTWWESELNALLEDPASICFQVFNESLRRLRIRREQPAFHPQAEQTVVDLGERIFALERRSVKGGQVLLCVSNFSEKPQEADLSGYTTSSGPFRDVLHDKAPLDIRPRLRLRLDPYETRWLEVK